MSKIEKIKKRSAPSKILPLSFPDPETAAFWRMTANDLNEYAARIAKFSRAVGGKQIRSTVRSSDRRWQDVAIATLRQRPLGTLLVMPRKADPNSRLSCR